MTSHDMVPATRVFPSMIKVPPHATNAPTLNGVHNFVADHVLRPHELDHTTVKPLPLHAPMHGTGRAEMLKSDHNRSFSSDENALNKQILGTHAADIETVNMRPVLSVAEEIIHLGKPLTADATHGAQIQSHLDTLDEKKLLHSSINDDKGIHGTYYDHAVFPGFEHDSEIVEVLAYPINKTLTEMICKCSSGEQAHSITMDLLKLLANYSWDAKVVITIAAFAIKYGEFWLVEHLYTKNQLAKNIAILKDLPDTLGHAGDLRKKFEAVLDLLDAVLKVTHCIIEFRELPVPYISRESPEMLGATAHIPIAVYWIIRSLLGCMSTLINLTGGTHEYITSTGESWEMLSMAHKLSIMLDHLQNQLMICKRFIERKKLEDDYAAFKKLMEQSHSDNMKVMKAMIRSKEDQRPLYDGSKRLNERIEVLRLKYVLLLISDLQLPHEELNVLHMIFNQQTMRHEYEVLWLPIIDPKTPPTAYDAQFYDLRNKNMPWFSVDHPTLIEPVATRYIKEVWKFEHMPMVVVLDPQAKPSNIDALPVMWIWGSNAFPFTKIQEKALWADRVWNIELLADAIDPRIPEWIMLNRVICLYGGEDIEWIRKFTISAKAIATNLNVPLEMLYVGKRNPRGKVQRCHEIIDREKLSHIFSLKDYYDYVWYFWVRLWSMLNSKKQLGMSVENDHIMQEIMDVLTFDSSEQGWAVFSRGNYEMTKGNGNIIMPLLENPQTWDYKVDHPDKFVAVLDEEIKGTHLEHHCNRLILPGHAGYIPELVVCSECGKTMDKYVMYRCCTD